MNNRTAVCRVKALKIVPSEVTPSSTARTVYAFMRSSARLEPSFHWGHFFAGWAPKAIVDAIKPYVWGQNRKQVVERRDLILKRVDSMGLEAYRRPGPAPPPPRLQE